MNDSLEMERSRLRQVILTRADEAVRGEGDILDHARQVYRAWRRLEFIMNGVHSELWYEDEDRKFLLYVESELDRFPVGDERVLWASESLAELEPELAGMRRDWGPRLVCIFTKLRDQATSGSESGERE